METTQGSDMNVNSPTTEPNLLHTMSAAMLCQSNLLYDQHSSEEELEVINGPSSVLAAEAEGGHSSARCVASSLLSERGSSSLDATETCGEASTSKRCDSSFVENRKRSLAHSSDDELRTFLEPVLTPVNFRTSPPIEALKPNRSHMYRSTTPLILSEARYGIENIKICDNSVNSDKKEESFKAEGNIWSAGGLEEGVNSIKSRQALLLMTSSSSSHQIYQPQPKYHFHYNSSRSSPASTTALDAVDVRSVSPPAKLFHCSISPRRRPTRTHHAHSHASQRLQRPHRPCLDFDKMQQVSL